jgi:phage tail protein X
MRVPASVSDTVDSITYEDYLMDRLRAVISKIEAAASIAQAPPVFHCMDKILVVQHSVPIYASKGTD